MPGEKQAVSEAAVNDDAFYMQRALELARQGQGLVEPNPMVGCVIVHQQQIVGEGWHQQFGGPHAEVHALAQAGEGARDATAYVTLEPCCHHGKTPPCSAALLQAGVRRVVIALRDPFPKVAGGGIAQLEAAGVEVAVGLLEPQARQLLAPYLKLVERGRPWIIGKWAMTLDGKIATAAGDSQWISGESARQIVHQIRRRVDAILVGRRTAELDDPRLTARPAGPRTAVRIVIDTHASLSLDSYLARTAREVPVLLAVAESAPADRCAALEAAGVEVLRCLGATADERLTALLDALGQRRMTNILVEGGGQLLGSLHQAGELDEVHVFMAPKIIGGQHAPTPLAGRGVDKIAGAMEFVPQQVTQVGNDVYFVGRRAEA